MKFAAYCGICIFLSAIALKGILTMQEIEAVVAKVNDLQDGEKRQVSVGDTDVLLIRVDGNFHAVGAFCTHYQAPLAEGVLSGDRIICPWHNAYFNITTGDQQEPPGLDSLACYQVRIKGEDVIVSVPEKASGLRTPAMAQYNPNVDPRTFVIKDNQVLAAATSQRDTETAAITELMRLNKMPNPETLRQGNFDLFKHLHT